MRIFLGSVILFLAGTSPYVLAQPTQDPVGDVADYRVDTNRIRTTSYIRSGTMHAEVESFNAGDETTDATYTTRIDYEFQIQFLGRRAGSRMMAVPQEYFSQDFKENLRATGHYESEQFKIEHLGYADARNLDGAVYPNCDVIRFYDIQHQASIEWMTALLAPAFYNEDIEDMEIVAHVYDGIPVLGAVKIDMTGVYQGRDIKVGGDYLTP